MQLRWFHIRGVCIAPGCVYRSRSAKRGMGIPGDHVNRVETYQVVKSTKFAIAGAKRKKEIFSKFVTHKSKLRPRNFLWQPFETLIHPKVLWERIEAFANSNDRGTVDSPFCPVCVPCVSRV